MAWSFRLLTKLPESVAIAVTSCATELLIHFRFIPKRKYLNLVLRAFWRRRGDGGIIYSEDTLVSPLFPFSWEFFLVFWVCLNDIVDLTGDALDERKRGREFLGDPRCVLCVVDSDDRGGWSSRRQTVEVEKSFQVMINLDKYCEMVSPMKNPDGLIRFVRR